MRGFAIFITVFLSIIFAGNYYILRRLASFFSIKPGVGFYILLAAMTVSYITAVVFERQYPSWFSSLFYTAAAMWLGAGMLLITALAVSEPIIFLLKPKGTVVGVVILTVVVFLTAYSVINACRLHVETVAIPAPVDMKIVHLSDIHLGSVEKGFLRRVVERTNALGPDAVLITGDMVDPDGRTQGCCHRSMTSRPLFFS